MSDDEDGNDIDIAAIMGFGSFGSQPQPKRRKMNNATVDSSTGANTTSLGIRQRAAPSQDDEVTTTTTPINTQDLPAGEISNQISNPKEKRAKKQPAPSGLAGYISRGQAIAKPAPASTIEQSIQYKQMSRIDVDPALSKALSDLSKDDLSRLRKGVTDAKGEPVYFQPSFIEDPWAPSASHRGIR